MPAARNPTVKPPYVGASGPGSPGPPPDQPEMGDQPERDRHDVQLFIGQLHGLLDAINGMSITGVSPEDRESLEAAYREASFRFGTLHADLNAGRGDVGFEDNGLSGRQLSHKLKRWRDALKSFVRSRTARAGVKALRASHVLLGSLVAVVPVAEPIRELVDTFIETLSDAGPND